MKKIMNQPETVVEEMCRGIVEAHPELELLPKYKVIKKKKLNPDKVTLISGGGSGHEPAHAGFVGTGMLDAAVCGDMFASPSQIQIYQAIRNTASKKGTLLIIKNYSGDMMNFKNAAYLAQEDGICVDYVKVDDDIAVKDSLYTVGKRGVAGTVFVHKLAGAAAERGMELSEVKRIAQKTIKNVRSIGFALTSCTVPAKGTPTFTLEEDEIEYGVGIHGEPGIRREKVLTANKLAARMTEALVQELDAKEAKAALLINGFGATPLQELYLLNHAVMNELDKKCIKVVKILVGNYMTSIDMAGASISLLKLDDELENLMEDVCDTPALKSSGVDVHHLYQEKVQKKDEVVSYEIETDFSWSQMVNEVITKENLIYMVDAMSDCIIRNEVPFCELDSHAGDGDFGMSVAKGFRQLKAEWKDLMKNHTQDMGSFLDACSLIIMEHCGGASGPIWGSAFRAAGKLARGRQFVDAKVFADMMQAAVKGIQSTGERSFGRGAVIGDKTLIDALIPCADCWSRLAGGCDIKTIMKEAAQAAVAGADATKEIVARMGRAGTVGERSLGYPDAGAYGLGVIFTELSQKMH